MPRVCEPSCGQWTMRRRRRRLDVPRLLRARARLHRLRNTLAPAAPARATAPTGPFPAAFADFAAFLTIPTGSTSILAATCTASTAIATAATTAAAATAPTITATAAVGTADAARRGGRSGSRGRYSADPGLLLSRGGFDRSPLQDGPTWRGTALAQGGAGGRNGASKHSNAAGAQQRPRRALVLVCPPLRVQQLRLAGVSPPNSLRLPHACSRPTPSSARSEVPVCLSLLYAHTGGAVAGVLGGGARCDGRSAQAPPGDGARGMARRVRQGHSDHLGRRVPAAPREGGRRRHPRCRGGR